MQPTITIYHHPRCSKSREALAIAEQFARAHSLPLQVVDYQQTPLSLQQLSTLQQRLDCTAAAMVRDSEEEFTALRLHDANDAALLAALAQHPKLLQRPIVVAGEAALIARPPAQLSAWLDAQLAAR